MSSSKPALLCRDALNAVLLSSCHQRPHTATHLQARGRRSAAKSCQLRLRLSVRPPALNGSVWCFTTEGPFLQSSSSTLCFTSAQSPPEVASRVFLCFHVNPSGSSQRVPPLCAPSLPAQPSAYHRPSPESWELLAHEMGLLSQVRLPLLTEGGGRIQWGGALYKESGGWALGSPHTLTDRRETGLRLLRCLLHLSAGTVPVGPAGEPSHSQGIWTETWCCFCQDCSGRSCLNLSSPPSMCPNSCRQRRPQGPAVQSQTRPGQAGSGLRVAGPLGGELVVLQQRVLCFRTSRVVAGSS